MNAARTLPPKYVEARTFGDLRDGPNQKTLHWSSTCSFCKADRYNKTDYKGARKYSTRHYICDPCIEGRRDVVLPAVLKHERFQRRIAEIRSQEVQS